MKGISLFFVYPVVMFGLGFFAGVQSMHFFYPGAQNQSVIQKAPTNEPETEVDGYSIAEQENQEVLDLESARRNEPGAESTVSPESEDLALAAEVSSSMETLCVDTEYVLEERDVVNETVVETVWKLPDKYIGLNREQFLDAMEAYEAFPPLSEIERGFVSLEVLSFSRERVVVQMNYQYIQPSTSFYLAVRDNEVVVYLEDMETIYIYTGIELSSLPEDMQQEIIQMIWIEDEERLYNFLENYSS